MAGAALDQDWNLSKEFWPQTDIYDEVFESSAALGMMPKDTGFTELARHIAVGTGLPQGVGTKYEVANGNMTPSTAEQFRLVEKTLYVLISIRGILMRKSKVKQGIGLIVDEYARESRLAINQWKNEQSTYIYGNGGGSLGQISSTSVLTTSTFTLKNPNDIRHFATGMYLNFAASDGSEFPLGSSLPGRVKIVGISYHGPNKGTIVTDAPAGGIAGQVPGVAVNQYIFRDGIYGDVIPGFNAWIPRADPGQVDPVTGITVPTTFLGVSRVNNPSGLAGIRHDGTNETIYNALYGAASDIADARGKADWAFISIPDFQKLRVEMSGAGILTNMKEPAAKIDKYRPGVMYNAFEITGPTGPLKVMPDPWCPVGRGYVLMSETWTYLSVGEMVQVIGDPLRYLEGSDAAKTAFVGDGLPYCEAPLYNSTVQFTAGA